MGNSQSIIKINFEDMQHVCKNKEQYLLLNTLPEMEQGCLIKNTLVASSEVAVMDNYLKSNRAVKIIIYGKHCNDELAEKKYHQLLKLGFSNVYIYGGGMFEWLLLQDIYGTDEFPTSSKQTDHLKYKPGPRLNILQLCI
jgi:hypothetical protein